MRNTVPYLQKKKRNENLISLEKLFFLKGKKNQIIPKVKLSNQLSKKVIDHIKEYLTQDQYRELIRDSFGNSRKKEQLRIVIHSHVSSKEFMEEYSSLITDYESDEVTDILVEKIAGLDVLQKLAEEPTVTDIKVLDWQNIRADDIHKGKYKTDIRFESEQDYIELCHRFSFASGKNFSNAKPSIDAIFPYMRVNIVGYDLSPKTSLQIRLVSKDIRLSEEYMRETGYATEEMIALLKRTFATESHLISGATSTGKTELLRYYTRFTKPQSDIIMIEDTPETYLDEVYPHLSINMWKNREASDDKKEDFGYKYHLKNAMRQNPDYIFIQESRGSEAGDVLKASSTGHIVNTTLHAESTEDAVYRFIDLCQENQFHPADHYGRRVCRNFKIGIHIERFNKVRKINQIVEYLDYENDKVVENVLFQYDPLSGKHEQVNPLSESMWMKLLKYHEEMPELEKLRPKNGNWRG